MLCKFKFDCCYVYKHRKCTKTQNETIETKRPKPPKQTKRNSRNERNHRNYRNKRTMYHIHYSLLRCFANRFSGFVIVFRWFRYFGLVVSVVTVVLFRWFRFGFGVSSFSTCRKIGIACNLFFFCLNEP